MGFWLDDRVSIPDKDKKLFSFCHRVHGALGLTQSPVLWVRGTLFPRVKRLENVAEEEPPFSPEVKNRGAILSFPYMPT
jgi:hypothetical protein